MKRPKFYLPSASWIMLAGFALRMWRLGSASLWIDEVLTEVRAHGSLRDCLTSLIEAGNQMPFYFFALRLFPTPSEGLLRLPSVLLGLIGIALIMFLATRLYRDYRLALWAGALVAFNPYHIWLSRTARPYPLIFVLVLLASYYFITILRRQQSRWTWAAFTVVSMVAYLTHYFTLVLPAVQLLLLVVILPKHRPLLRSWVYSQAIAVLPLLGWLLYLALHWHQIIMGGQWIPTPGGKDIILTLWNMTIGYDGTNRWYVLPGVLIGLAVIGSGLIASVRARKIDPINAYWLCLLFLPFASTFVLSTSIVSLYVDRYFIVFFPALIYLILTGVWWLPVRARRAMLAVILVTGLANVILALASGSYERENWHAAVAYIQAERQPDDKFVVENRHDHQAFERYYGCEMPVTEIHQYAKTGDLASLDNSLSGRVWVIFRNPIEDIHRHGVMPQFNPFASRSSDLSNWLRQYQVVVVSQKSFNGVTLLLLDLSAASHPSNWLLSDQIKEASNPVAQQPHTGSTHNEKRTEAAPNKTLLASQTSRAFPVELFHFSGVDFLRRLLSEYATIQYVLPFQFCLLQKSRYQVSLVRGDDPGSLVAGQ